MNNQIFLTSLSAGGKLPAFYHWHHGDVQQ